MAKGDGTIIEKSRGVWEVQIPLGRDPLTGKYRKKSRTVRGTKAQARKVRDQMRAELDSGLKVDGDKITLRQFCDEFIAAKRAAGKASQDTINRDKSRLDYICDIIGDEPLRSIDARAVDALYREIRRRREAEGRRCGNTALRAYHVIFNAVMKKAVDYDLILRNPCDRIDPPTVDKVDRRSLSVDEAARLLAAIDAREADALASLAEKERRQAEWCVADDRGCLLGMRDVCYLLAVRIGLATGLRLGEVLAIPWGAVDFRRGTIAVRQSLGVDMLPKAPKTEAGARTVAVDAETMGHLRRWLPIQRELLDTLCLDVDGDTPVLCSATGGWLDKNNFGRWWREFRKEIGFPALKFHELRHTQATQLLANGVDLKTVQTRMGHATSQITMDFYAHAVPENDEKCADLIGELFNKRPKGRIIELPKSA